jgi:hypothetical protein
MNTEQTKFAVLGGADQAALDPNGFYLLDFDKITTIDDIKRILAAIGFNFVGNHPRIALVADLLDRDNPIYPPKEFEVEEDLSKLNDYEDDVVSADGYATNENEIAE